MPLQHKHRPTCLDEIYGNKLTIKTIDSILDRPNDELPHSYLITGPSGCGKTTLGRIIASEVGAEGLNYKELDTADFRGIDTVRDIRKKMYMKPISGNYRVWMMDEIHAATPQCLEALLKALEEPPKHVLFILCTTDPEKLKVTLKRRCTHLEMNPIADNEMKEMLSSVAEKEDLELSEKVSNEIIKLSGGSPGIAVKILDEIVGLDDKDMLTKVQSYRVMESDISDLVQSLLKREAWKSIMLNLKRLKEKDHEKVRRAVYGYAGKVLESKGDEQAYIIMCTFENIFYTGAWAGLVKACYDCTHD